MKKNKNKYKKIIFIFSALLLVSFILWGNFSIKVSEYTYESEEIPKSFNGFRIAHISDLHDAEHQKIISTLENSNVDIIAVTGDSVDCNRPDTKHSLKFFEKAVKIAPCYYVTGNHEAWIEEKSFFDFLENLSSLGVFVLRNESKTIEKNGESIIISGIDDPDFAMGENKSPLSHMSKENIQQIINTKIEENKFNILLSHRPEYFENYVSADVDIVLSGHAHGGQFQIPFIGGLYAPGQGFLPQYDSGAFEKENTTMYVSQGLGNSVFPIRFNNRPQIIIVELKSFDI